MCRSPAASPWSTAVPASTQPSASANSKRKAPCSAVPMWAAGRSARPTMCSSPKSLRLTATPAARLSAASSAASWVARSAAPLAAACAPATSRRKPSCRSPMCAPPRQRPLPRARRRRPTSPSRSAPAAVAGAAGVVSSAAATRTRRSVRSSRWPFSMPSSRWLASSAPCPPTQRPQRQNAPIRRSAQPRCASSRIRVPLWCATLMQACASIRSARRMASGGRSKTRTETRAG